MRELIAKEPIIQDWFATTLSVSHLYFQASQPFMTTVVGAFKSWIAIYGPLGLFMAIALASVISPIPNEIVLAFAGMVMTPVDVAISGALGSTVVGMLSYSIARLGGRPLVEKFVKKKTIALAGEWFARRGRLAVLLGRLIPFIPFDAVSYFAGLAKMKIHTFTILTFLGSIPRCLFYAYMGEMIAQYNVPALIVLSVICLLVFLAFGLRQKESSRIESALNPQPIIDQYT
jgi:uncharacterized membrane protein YdjX (TVP38/TMEM64 family)